MPSDLMNAEKTAQRRRRRARVPVDALAHEGLFLVLTNLRAANAQSLFDLYFKRRGVKSRTAMRRLHDLVDGGFLAHVRLDNARCLYHLTEKTCALTRKLEERAHSALYTPPPDRQAAYCWLRSRIFAQLSDMGYAVGNDPAALYALRRFLIDRLEAAVKNSPPGAAKSYFEQNLAALRRSERLRVTDQELMLGFRTRCRVCGAERVITEHEHAATKVRCNGKLRAGPASILDVAWKRNANGYEAMIVFIDNPTLSLKEQLSVLELITLGIPPLPVIVRSTDPRSRFDITRGQWIEIGPRHRELDVAFNDTSLKNDTTIVDPWPTLQAYPVRDPHTKLTRRSDPNGAKPKRRSGRGNARLDREHEHERIERDDEREHAPLEASEHFERRARR
jgi:hypothetical protein